MPSHIVLVRNYEKLWVRPQRVGGVKAINIFFVIFLFGDSRLKPEEIGELYKNVVALNYTFFPFSKIIHFEGVMPKSHKSWESRKSRQNFRILRL